MSDAPRRIERRLLVVLLLPAIILAVSVAEARGKKSAPAKRWSARYVSGALDLRVGSHVLLTVGADAIAGEEKHGASFSIPIAAIAEVGYDQQSHSKGWAWLKGAGSAGGGGGHSGIVAAPLLIGAALAAPFKSKEHYVRLLWQEDANVKEAVFEVGKHDYLELLAEIQRATGKPWRNMLDERKRLDDELSKATYRRIPLELDRNIAQGDGEVRAGAYQIVVLEREANLAELFLFSGKDASSKVAVAQIMARAAPSVAGVASARVLYREEEGLTTIAEIRLPEKTLLLAGLTIPHSELPAARRFYAGDGWWAIVSRMEHGGQPALRFSVAHLKPGRSYRCRGFLFVTRDDVSFEPGADVDNRCDYFRATRDDLKVSQSTSRWIGATLKIVVRKKTYSFTALLERGSGEQRLPMMGKTREAGEALGRYFVQAVTQFEDAQRETQPAPAAPLN